MAKKKTKKVTKKMSHQRELFAQFYVAGKPKTDAHKLAGFSAKNRKDRANEASRMSRIPEVAARIKELKAELAAEFAYTRNEEMKELEAAQKIAMGAPVPMPDGTVKELPVPNPAAVIKAIEKKIDLSGIEPAQKHDVNVTGGIRLTLPGEMTREEWEAEE